MDSLRRPRALGTTGRRDLRKALLFTLAAADPGLTRLRVATRAATSVALALFGEWAFVVGTDALEVPAPARATATQLATVGAQHHQMLVVAMLLGGLVAMLCGMNANETTATEQSLTLIFIGLSVAASLALGLWLGPHRDLALVVMVVVLVIGAYGRRFGQRGAVTGVLLFIGYFFGFFLSSLGVQAAGWLAAEIGVATASALVVRAVLFRPAAGRELRLAITTYEARLGKVLDASAALFEQRSERRRRDLARWVLRLDEAALIVEGQMARPGGLGADAAQALRSWMFDTEVAASNVGRYADLLAHAEHDPARCLGVRRAIDALRAGDLHTARQAAVALAATSNDGVTAEGTERASGAAPSAPGAGVGPVDDDSAMLGVIRRRFSRAVVDLADALEQDEATRSRRVIDGGQLADDSDDFDPVVTLRGGWLPGSADVSNEASLSPTRQVRLAPYVRTSAQMAIAVTIAIVAGDALDATRFYWAVVAALLALIGTNTVAEQLRKAAHRVVGTLAGVLAGTELVDLVGHHSVWSLVVVVGGIGIGIYFFRVNYAVMAMAVTVSLSQAYFSLGEFSNGLLWVRLAETSVGAAAAMVTVLLVLPLRTRRVLDVALAGMVDASASLAAVAAGVISGSSPAADLRTAARAVDAAFQALMATAEPLRLVAWSDSRDTVTRQLAAATAVRNSSRSLAADAQVAAYRVQGDARDEVQAGIDVLQTSAAALAAHLRNDHNAAGSYRRAAPWFSGAEDSDAGPDATPTRNFALRDLVLLDDAFAGLALASGMRAVRPAPSELMSPPSTLSPSSPASVRSPTSPPSCAPSAATTRIEDRSQR